MRTLDTHRILKRSQRQATKRAYTGTRKNTAGQFKVFERAKVEKAIRGQFGNLDKP